MSELLRWLRTPNANWQNFMLSTPMTVFWLLSGFIASAALVESMVHRDLTGATMNTVTAGVSFGLGMGAIRERRK